MTDYERNPAVEVAEPEARDEAPPDPADDPRREAPPAFTKSVAREYFESIVVTFIMALFGMTFVTQAVKVPTGSMLNTILVEDHLMVNKFVFGAHPTWLDRVLAYREIRRGDIIVFKYPRKPEENYVKRVIGLPGDTIEVRGTRVFINGAELPENRVFVDTQAAIADAKADLIPVEPPKTADSSSHTVYYLERSKIADAAEQDRPPRPPSGVHSSLRDFAVDEPFTVPEGHYFCLGDNRDNSEDSRFWGTVPRENVIGRAMFVYWSFNEPARPFDAEGTPLDLFQYTRWGRTGTLIK